MPETCGARPAERRDTPYRIESLPVFLAQEHPSFLPGGVTLSLTRYRTLSLTFNIVSTGGRADHKNGSGSRAPPAQGSPRHHGSPPGALSAVCASPGKLARSPLARVADSDWLGYLRQYRANEYVLDVTIRINDQDSNDWVRDLGCRSLLDLNTDKQMIVSVCVPRVAGRDAFSACRPRARSR